MKLTTLKGSTIKQKKNSIVQKQLQTSYCTPEKSPVKLGHNQSSNQKRGSSNQRTFSHKVAFTPLFSNNRQQPENPLHKKCFHVQKSSRTQPLQESRVLSYPTYKFKSDKPLFYSMRNSLMGTSSRLRKSRLDKLPHNILATQQSVIFHSILNDSRVSRNYLSESKRIKSQIIKYQQ